MSRVFALLTSEILQLWEVWTGYNPERHYMRGPGPKWREKHAMQGEPPTQINGSDAVVSSR